LPLAAVAALPAAEPPAAEPPAAGLAAAGLAAAGAWLAGAVTVCVAGAAGALPGAAAQAASPTAAHAAATAASIRVSARGLPLILITSCLLTLPRRLPGPGTDAATVRRPARGSHPVIY
jgi:hypothetical protein